VRIRNPSPDHQVGRVGGIDSANASPGGHLLLHRRSKLQHGRANGDAGDVALGFFGRFALLLAAFQGVVLLPWADRAYYGCLCANARVAGAVLRGFGEDVHVFGVIIRTAGYAVAIRRGCDAIEPAWFFCAAVLAFPLPWRRKWPGLLAGTAVLFAVNLLRIVSLYFIGRRIPPLFPSAHLEWWPAAFILAAIALWLAWIGWARSRPPADEKV
jgi:exosortase H (IPTLxxWG-CTERM-specific)